MPDGQALYDPLRDYLACSRLHTRSVLYDIILYMIIKYNYQIKRPLFYSSIGSR